MAHRWISKKRRTKEDGRFITGRGRFVADVRLPGMLHVALVASPYPSARILSVDISAALALPGVHAVLTGDELATATNPLANPLDTPGVKCYPLATGVTRYVGEWMAAVVADDRYIAEDAAELVEVDYEPLPFVVDAEEALDPASPVVHAEHGSNVLYRRTFTWGAVAEHFEAAPHELAFRARWGRSATVPIETFGVLAGWNAGEGLMDIWASIQMPSYPEQISSALRLPANNIRVHYDVDVGGSYGVKRGIKHTVLVAYLARKLGLHPDIGAKLGYRPDHDGLSFCAFVGTDRACRRRENCEWRGILVLLCDHGNDRRLRRLRAGYRGRTGRLYSMDHAGRHRGAGDRPHPVQ